MDKLPVRHDDGPARRGHDVDGPTHRSFARLESNGRPCQTVEIRVATVATGSQSARGKRWGWHEGLWCAVARPVAPPAEQGQPRPTPRRSGRCRRIECSSYASLWPGSALFQERWQLFKHPLRGQASGFGRNQAPKTDRLNQVPPWEFRNRRKSFTPRQLARILWDFAYLCWANPVEVAEALWQRGSALSSLAADCRSKEA